MKFQDNYYIRKNDYNFWSWVGHSKVLDKDGYPLIVFHGTIIPNKTYHILMQFGTYETENQRLRMLFGDPDSIVYRHLHEDYIKHADQLKIVREHPWGTYDEYDIYPKHAMIIPAFLHIANPLYMSKDIAFFSKKINALNPEYVGILLEAGYSEQQIKKLTYDKKNEIVNVMLLDKGYDGVCFENIAEGNGDKSWIIVDPTQVYPLFEDRPKISTIIGKL